MRLLILLVFLPIHAYACSAGYDLIFDGQCVQKYGGYTYHQAKKMCQDQGDFLLRLKTEENAKQYRGGNVWLGLQCDGKDFRWDYGSLATYTYFGFYEVCNSTRKDYHYWARGEDGLWFSDEGDRDLPKLTVCQSAMRSWTCDSYPDYLKLSNNDVCFLFDSQLVTLSDANGNCASQKATIAPIHDDILNNYIKRSAIGNGLTGGVQIGLQSIDGKLVWDDGSDADYVNFAPGFPDFSYGNCFAMDTSFFPGKWMNIDCSALLPYACTKPTHNYGDSDPAGCPLKNVFFPGEEVYSPTWGSATGPAFCQYALVEPDNSKKVTIEITFFESNMCCDQLSIYDGMVGYNVLENMNGYYGYTSIKLTGTSNTIRMEWNATSGAHVRGWHARVGSV